MHFNQSEAKFGLIKDIKGQIFLNYKYKCNSSVKGSFLKKNGYANPKTTKARWTQDSRGNFAFLKLSQISKKSNNII